MGRGSIAAVAVSGMAVCSALCAGPGPARAAASAAVHAASSAPASVWATAQEVPGLAALNHDLALVGGLSCSSPGNCAVGGDYRDRAYDTQAFVADQRNGTWGRAIELPGTAALNRGGNADMTSISCTSPGECTAGGYYSPAGTAAGGTLTASAAFVASETGGTWGKATEVPGLAALDAGHYAQVSALSCWSPGDCTAAGTYAPGTSSYGYPDTLAFAVTETAGTWGDARALPGVAALNGAGSVGVSSISCTQAGSCAVGGDLGSAPAGGAFVADESAGTWQPAEQIPGITALSPGGLAAVISVSCASPGNCGATGYSVDIGSGTAGFVASEMNGTWGAAHLLAGALIAYPISCPSAGDCAAGGTYDAGSGNSRAFVVSAADGTWGKPRLVSGLAATNSGQAEGTIWSVSCSAPGNCAAGGGYADHGESSQQPFFVTETNGTWGRARQVPGIAALNRGDLGEVDVISCPSRQACTAAGNATGSPAPSSLVFVVSTGTPTATAASLSRPTVIYGREQAERVSVTVTARTGRHPVGKVTVRARSAVLCVITLHSAGGACRPHASRLSPGTYRLVAVYPGNADFTLSQSPAQTLTVVG